MLSLTLHIVFAAGFGLAVKAAAMQRRDLIVVGAVNYILAGLMAAVWVLARGGADLGWAGGVYGGLNGVVYFVAYFFLIYGIKHSGIAGTGAVAQLSVLVPIVAAVFVWREYPTKMQLTGMTIAGAAIVLMDARKNMAGDVVGGLGWRLLAFFVLVGGSRLFAKAFAEIGAPEEKAFYVLMVYVVSGAASVALLLRHGKMPNLGELGWAAVVGACNMIQVTFLLKSLEELPAAVVFPVSACGGLILTAVVAVALLGERLTTRMYAGLAAAAAAVFFLNK
ncbi:MAG: EamA family transporter [Candidatus Poribacteria bacterium]